MNYPKKLSMVIPVFNEEARIKKALKICDRFENKFPQWQFIFMNDGSTDKTEQIIRKKVNQQKSFKLISYKKNQGKGYALKQGVKEAEKPLVLLSDVDFSTPLTELPKLYKKIKKSFDIAIGSRKAKGAIIKKHQPKIREWLGKQFTNLSNLSLGLSVSDVTCGFKLFKNKAAKKLFLKSKIKGWGYDAEILFLAKKYGFKTAEVPVEWENDQRTKVNLGKDIVRSLFDLVKIRFCDLLDNY